MATAYAESLKVRLVILLLATPRVQEATRPALLGINLITAVITSVRHEAVQEAVTHTSYNCLIA